MKRMITRLVAILAVSVLSTGVGNATNISRQQAAQLARDFMAAKFSSSSARRAAQTVPLNQVETGQELVYAFNVEGGGFVVVAGDDCAPAILGYSETAAIDPADMPEGMKDLFAQYQQEMQSMMANGQRATAISTLGDEIKPLIKSRWGQGAPYNYMCPRYYKNGTKTLQLSLTGCVATAIAQILYYHKFPAEIAEIPGEYYNIKKNGIVSKPNLTQTLEWDKMLPTYGVRSATEGTQEQQDAVAKLMRLVGQSVCMEYTPESSGSSGAEAYTSFVNFFKYDASTIKFLSRADYTYADWVKIIYDEMVAGRPVYYAGYSSTTGHAFVVHGYKSEDFFYINWGWYDKDDNAFRLSLCNPPRKYEGGGTGDQGYTGSQSAVVGIQPGTTPGHVGPLLRGFMHWKNKDSYTRASVAEDFKLKDGINQWIYNGTHYIGNFSYGAVVTDADGNRVKELLPLNDKTKDLALKAGTQLFMGSQPINVGAGLGNGTYTIEFLYRIGEGEWESFASREQVVFKIDGNTLTFNARPDWLTAEMVVTKMENADVPSYGVAIRLENRSEDKTYQRSLKLGRDDAVKNYENRGFAVVLEPGETKTLYMLYQPVKYTPKMLYLVALEDGSPICQTTIEGGGAIGDPTFNSDFNVTADLKQQTDQSYVLKTDVDYEVVCTVKNTGDGDYTGYLELTDSIKDTYFGTDFELTDSRGELVSLKAGETKQLKLTIANDYDTDIVHKLGFVIYSDNGEPITMSETSEFTIHPVYDLSFTDFDVTPKESVSHEYADYIVKGNKATVSGKIKNTEGTDFEGTIVIRRYTTDFGKEALIDEDGEYYVDYDKIFMTDVTIPANGSYDYSQEFDLQGLVSSTDYNVIMDFEITFIPSLSGDEIPLYYSSSYLLNDASPTGISIVKSSQSTSQNYYDLLGRKLSQRPGRGIYIHNGRKYYSK